MFDEEPTSPTTSADNSGTSASKADTSSHHSPTLQVIIIVAILVLVGGITGGVFAFQKYQHSQAVSACVRTVKPLQSALTNLHTQQSAKSTTELVKLDVSKLADKTTHTTLATAVKPVNVTVASCASALSTVQLTANTSKNKRVFTRVKTATSNLTSAIQKLTASRTLQSRNLLTAEVKSGQQLVKDSQGKVQDQKTLDQLNTVLTASNKLAQEKTADYTKLDKQLAEVKKAEQAVRDSVEAKRKADEEAARKAEEARQAAAQAARTYQTPRYQAPTRNYQAPAQNNGGDSRAIEVIEPDEPGSYQWNGKDATPEDMCLITGMCG